MPTMNPPPGLLSDYIARLGTYRRIIDFTTGVCGPFCYRIADCSPNGHSRHSRIPTCAVRLTLVAWYRSLYAPRAGGRMTSHHRTELLKEAVPGASQVAVMLNPDDPTDADAFKAYPAAASALGLSARLFAVRAATEFEGA